VPSLLESPLWAESLLHTSRSSCWLLPAFLSTHILSSLVNLKVRLRAVGSGNSKSEGLLKLLVLYSHSAPHKLQLISYPLVIHPDLSDTIYFSRRLHKGQICKLFATARGNGCQSACFVHLLLFTVCGG
jgi:hypothetical protein